MNAKWAALKPELQRLVNEGCSDDEIAVHFGVKSQSIYLAKRRHGIVSPGAARAAPEPAPMQPEIYTDKDGHQVKRYPPMYADGAFIQMQTAKPRR